MSPLVALASPEPLGNAERHYTAVSLRLAPVISAGEEADAIDWFAACYRLTSRVERVSMQSAILDLGVCTAQEAQVALQGLLDHLEQHGLRLRAGIGPTPVLAQLTCLMAPAREQPQCPPLISLADTPAFLKRVPIERLLMLAPLDAITVETLARLRRCGLRTLGQLARLDELTLRRQFGAAGAHLAALTQGRSLHPFSPTPQSRNLRFRLRLASPLHADDVLRRLPGLAASMAKTLNEQGYEAGQMSVVMNWTSGGRLHVSHRLRWHISKARLLEQELARLALPLLRQDGERPSDEQIEDIRCTLSDLQRPRPSQAVLLPQGRSALSDRQQQLRDLATALAQRRKRPMLLTSHRVAEHAIFSEDGYVFTPLGSGTLAPVTNAVAAEPSTPARRLNRWQETPLRLHWW